jgi:hypothetical protein
MKSLLLDVLTLRFKYFLTHNMAREKEMGERKEIEASTGAMNPVTESSGKVKAPEDRGIPAVVFRNLTAGAILNSIDRALRVLQDKVDEADEGERLELAAFLSALTADAAGLVQRLISSELEESAHL